MVTVLTKLKTTGGGLELGADQLIFGCIHLRGLTDCDTDVFEESQKVNDL